MQSIKGGKRFVDVSTAMLRQGYAVRFRASGGSMSPSICDGDVITVRPMATSRLSRGRVVVYRDSNRLFAHRIVEIGADPTGSDRVILRGDASRVADAPIEPSQVLGEVVSVTRGQEAGITRGWLREVRHRAAAIMLALCTLAVAGAFPAPADAAVLQQVQSGTTVNSANGIQTVTIASVDITKSFLIFQTRSTGDRPVSSTVRGRLASSTTIQFERVTNEGAPLPINIQWYVATFGSGVTVQRGQATMSALTVDTAITAVASMNQAFVLWSMTPNPTELEHGADDVITGDLTSTTNLQFRTNDPSGHVVWWQVVEFTNPSDINVQRGSVTTLTGATLSTTATIPTPVDVSRTFVLAGMRTDGAGADVGARMIRTQLTNTNTISFDRGIAGTPDNVVEISWQAVELKDGSTVQRGSASFAAGVAQNVATLVTRVNTTRAIAFASGQAGGQSMGRTPYAANDIMGVAMTTAALSPTQLTLDRNSTLDTADVGWFVVQFAGGNGFKVGSFTKATGAAPASQSIPHGLGEVPKALILWTEARPDESFSSSSGITSRGASSGSAATGVLSISLPVPAGTVTNDYMIASVAVRPTTAVITPPAGWTLVRRVDNAATTANSLAVYTRIATGSEPASYSWTLSASTGSAGGIQSFAGVDLANPIDVENGVATASSVTHLAPSVTTTAANDMVVTTHSFASGATWTPPAGMTQGYDVSSNNVPDALGMSVIGSYAVQAAIGATGTKSATASNDADAGNTHTMALRAAPAGMALFGFGMADGTTSRSVATSSQDVVGTSNASTRMANKVLTLVRWGEVLVAEADLSSWNDTTFTLNWTTNDANSYVIHFVAIGGSDVSAKVVDWTMATAVGNRTVTGVGFAPDVVFHAHGGHALTAALPTNIAGGAFGLGVMDFDGDQWAFANWTVDASFNSDTQRGQVTDAALLSFNATPTVQKRASWVSMNADGFTMNFTNTGSVAAARVFSLALKGVNVKPGFFLKSTTAAPASQPITGVGFRPSLVMLASFQSTTQANPVANSRFGLGASDGTTEGSSATQDLNGSATMNVDAIDKTSKVFVKLDNSTPAIDAEADLTSLDADGFTLNWTTNDAVQTQILYLSLAPLAVTEVRLISLTASRESQGVHVAWRTGFEVNNLGFHVYREIDGRRTRVTKSLVAGSGLTVAGRGRVNSEQSYSFWDRDPLSRSPRVVYWLEDVEFSGKTTWHGPVSPVDATDRPGIVHVEDSPLLAGLGRGVGYSEERFVAAPEPTRRAAGAELAIARSAAISVQAAATAAQQAQWAIAGGLAVKIGVRASGWYRVDQATLVAAGLNSQVDPSTLRLFLEGIEQPIVVTGAGDGHFDSSDAIEFYGTGVDTPSTDTAVYWLTGSTGTGLRVQTPPAGGPGPAAPARFWGTVERKDRSIYFGALRNGRAENWFGQVLEPTTPADFTVTVRRPDPSAPTTATLEVILQGASETLEPIGHQVAVRVNGTPVGNVTFEGRDQGAATLTVPHALLLDGDNVVQLEAVGGPGDFSLFDTLRLSYWHTNDADDDQLELNAASGQTVTIGAFSSSAIRVVDITDPQSVLELATAGAGSGPFSVDVQTPGVGTRTLLAFTDLAIKSPVFVVANQPSSLHATDNARDYVIVSHPDFATQMASLAAHRAAQGRSATVVSIDDVYDEFSFGARSPDALKDFLAHARATWSVPPRYVVLAGDATFDPRDYAALGFGDLVPTAFVDMAEVELETSSDDWFVDGDSNGVPDLAIGRLPVRTAGQATAMVSRIVGYDAEPTAPWAKEVALVSDDDEPMGRFHSFSAGLATRLPSGFHANAIDLDLVLTPAVLRTQLFSAVGQGQLVVNYIGHGSSHIWGGGDLLTRADIGVANGWLAPGSRLPFVVAMNCLNGFFQDIYGGESLAETMVLTNGGAVAVWASSSLTEAEPQAVMNDELFRILFTTQGTLGDAIVSAKNGVLSQDVRRSWIFFGDPAMRLKGLPFTPPALPTLTVAPSTLNFGAVTSAGGAWSSSTPSQTVRVTQNGAGSATWTATTNQPWIQITNGSGMGTGRFTVSVVPTGLPSTGSVVGTITIAANGAQNSPTVSVRIAIMPSGTSNPPFGTIDTPVPGASGLSGAFAFTGWALDDVGVTRLQLFRDSVAPEATGIVYVGDAAFIAGARPDVETAFPAVPLNYRAGWGFMLLTNMLPNQGNGTYTVHALASDRDGNSWWIGSRTFTSNNASATKPFGSIDTPGLSQIASGTAFLNFGWALTQQPKVIPFDGSTITVVVDGVAVGHPGALGARADIQALFPGYANTNNAVGGFPLDTTAYVDGLHTIAWVVTDSAGETKGIGSRYFTIDNGSGGSLVQSIAADASAADSSPLPDAGAAVRVRRGDDENAPLEAVPSANGRREVLAYELDRIEIQLANDNETFGAWRYRGFEVVGTDRRALPIGSTLDAERGRFYWQPGAGFLGAYELVFVRTSVDGRSEQIPVQVILQPRHRNASDVQMAIDLPAPGNVASTFVVAGWAIDRAAKSGVGVDVLHVWAYPNPGSGASPIFVGAVRPGPARPDVGAYYGERFTDSLYQLVVTGLPAGTYDLAVFPHSTVTAQFEPAAVVRISIK
jgi:hypothetical protein